MLGADGQGFDIMMSVVLPVFAVLNAACSNGLMAGAMRRTVEHATRTRHADTGASLADLPTIRNYIARMRVKTDMSERAARRHARRNRRRARADAMLRVLECKAAAGETANEVLDLAMRVCGGAAFRKDVGVERFFRDARAAGVMAPDHRRALRLHRQGRLRHAAVLRRTHDDRYVLCCSAPSRTTRRSSQSGTAFRSTSTTRGLPFDYVLYTNYERQVEAHFAGHIDVAWNSPLAWLQSERIAARHGTTCRSDLHARHAIAI